MKIKISPTQQEIEIDPNKTVLQLCTEQKIEIKSICKGVPSCGECRVRVLEGEYNVLPPNKAEIALIGSSYFVDQRRLSCQMRCFGDVTIDLSEQIERAEFQSKKVRGFRTPGQKGSQGVTLAKQGTLVLEETKLPPSQNSDSPSRGTQNSGGVSSENSSNRSSSKEARSPRERHGGRDSRNPKGRGTPNNSAGSNRPSNSNAHHHNNRSRSGGGDHRGRNEKASDHSKNAGSQKDDSRNRDFQNQSSNVNSSANSNSNGDSGTVKNSSGE